jgi:hypothetical protein
VWEPSYQTVRLGVGRHHSPQHGVCVMELASMLAHEPFSDRPQSVCPVIGAFLRGYNDWLDDRRRQDLYAYAAKVVSSQQAKSIERERATRCLSWFRHRNRGILRFCFPLAVGFYRKTHACEVAGAWTAEMATQNPDDSLHKEALQLVDDLLSLGKQETRQKAAGPDELLLRQLSTRP